MGSARSWSWAMVLGLAVCGCGDRGSDRIRLAAIPQAGVGVATAASELRLSQGDERSIALQAFVNDTGDDGLDWLCRGLPIGVERELARSVTMRVYGPVSFGEVLKGAAMDFEGLGDDAILLRAAARANVKTLLSGRYFQEDGELVVGANLREVATGKMLATLEVRASSLEGLANLMADLAREVREQLADPTAWKPAEQGPIPVEALQHFTAGKELKDQVLIAKAEREFTKAVEIEPTYAAAWLLLAECKSTLGDRPGAVEALARARRYVDKLSRTEETQLRLHEARISGDMKRMRAIVEELRAEAPNDIEARFAVGSHFFHWGEYSRAQVELEQLLELNPRDKRAYNLLGYLHARRGDFNTAYKMFEAYRSLSPDEPNAYDSIGEVLMMQGRFEEAAEQFKQALAHWPEFDNSVARLVQVYAELGDSARALDYAARAVELAPSPKMRAKAEVRRATVLWWAGKTDAAADLFRRLQTSQPDELAVFWLGAEMARSLGRADEARATWRGFFDRHRESAARKDWSPEQVVWFMGRSLVEEVPPRELVAALEATTPREQIGVAGEMLELYQVVALLRAGEGQAAERRLTADAGKAIEALVEQRRVEREYVWRYLVDAVASEPRLEPAVYRIATLVKGAIEPSERHDVELLEKLLEAQYHGKYGRSEELAETYRSLGVPPDGSWRLAGPYDGRPGFHRAFPPEPVAPVRPGERLPAASSSSTVHWSEFDDSISDGYLDFARTFGVSDWAVGYAAVDISSPSERVVQLRLGSAGSCKLWLNGQQVWQIYRLEEAGIDTDVIQVMLRPGRNRLLVKLVNRLGDWGFWLRVTDDRGNGLPDLDFLPPGGDLAALGPVAATDS